MTCNDEYILFVVLLAAFSLVKVMEASGCVQMLFNLFSLKVGGCVFMCV